MICSRIARGFGFGSGMGSAAEPSPQRYFDYRERGTKLPANGREKWRRQKLLISCRNSQRLNKTYFRKSKTAALVWQNPPLWVCPYDFLECAIFGPTENRTFHFWFCTRICKSVHSTRLSGTRRIRS